MLRPRRLRSRVPASHQNRASASIWSPQNPESMPQDSLTHTQLGIPDSTPPESALNLPNHEEIWTNSNPEQEAQSIRNLLQISSQTNGLGRGGERWLCQSALQALQHDYNALLKPTFKKDF